MRKENKLNSRHTYILRPYESRSIRCRNALNKALKYDKSKKNIRVAIHEHMEGSNKLNYTYTFTPRLKDLTVDLFRTDDTGRLKEYIPVGSKYRVKSYLLALLIKYKNRKSFTLCINDIVFPLTTLDNIRFGDKALRIYGDMLGAWVYYGDIKRLEVL